MGKTPDDRSEPSLELPTLTLPGLGRRKRKRGQDAAEPVVGTPVPPEALPQDTAETPTEPPPGDTAAPGETAAPAQHGRRAERRRPQTSTPKAPRAQRTMPVVSGPFAAAVTGVLVGAAGAAATYGAMAGCEALRGVSTCGGAPGFLVLVAIFALMVLLGAGILRLFRTEAPGSTSFLGVGIVAVVVMLVLLDVVYSPWMFVAVPALAASAYLLAHWVTTRFDDETGRRDWS